MADCSSMESLLSSTIPPLIANGITVTLTCILLAFFDWRLALCVFITVPIAFLIIWLSRNHQKKLFEKQVDAKLAASDQVQEYLEGMKIIKSCGLSGSHFSALDKALLAMKKIAIKVEMAVGVFMSSASMILQAGIGITIFVGAILLTSGQIELLPLLMFLLMVTRIYGPILAILANLSSLLNLNVVTSRMRTLLTTPAMDGDGKTVPNCDIELSHVTFAYNQEDVIKDVSCKIPQGSVTALVGPSGSGKSTLAIALEGELYKQGILCRILDGDNIRSGINNNLGFSEADRTENIRRIAEVSKLFVDCGIVTIAAFISPTHAIRRMASEIIGEDDFLEVYVSTPIEECERRDVKGLYAKARRGEIKEFTGISSPFEAPEHPFISIDTSRQSLADSVKVLLEAVSPKITGNEFR